MDILKHFAKFKRFQCLNQKIKNPTNLTLRNFKFQKVLERVSWHILKFVSGVKVKIFEKKKFPKLYFLLVLNFYATDWKNISQFELKTVSFT